MAKVSLRIYMREIEGLIEQGHIDAAVAHCQHILKTYPKYLDAYRKLGKAYLESRRYIDATEVFQRVLMAAPDDFVAHVGMSIICDDDGKLDDAIWHMERAFEAQPSNSAVQGELQRLYGRRDGVEPPKVRMTRGALAHMYLAGELYPQAISEIRGVLAEDPDRTDMQVLLALAYFHSGQKVEASELATQLLKNFPYCLDANRILAEVLPGTGRAEDTEIYRKRVKALDPYTAYSKGSIFFTAQVTDSAVSLERLEFAPGKEPSAQPAWNPAPGLQPSSEGEQEQPAWLKAAGEESSTESEDWPAMDQEPQSDSEPEPTIEPESAAESDSAAAGDGQIPDWMRKAGWGESTSEAEEGPMDLTEPEAAAEELAQGDMPDWIKSMAPEGAEASAEAADVTPDGSDEFQMEDESDGLFDEAPDWLKNLKPESPEPLPTNEETPEWLKSTGEGQSEAAPKPATESEQPFEWQELPNESETSATEPGQEPAPAAAAFDIIPEAESPAVPPEAAPEPEAQTPLETAAPAQAVGDEEYIPEWLDEVPAAEEAASAPAADAAPAASGSSIGDLGTSLDDQDAAMAWLENLASKHGAKDEELVTDPGSRTDEAPDWVEQAKAMGEEVQPSPTPEQPAVPEKPDLTGLPLKFEHVPPEAMEQAEAELGPEPESKESESSEDWLTNWQEDLEQESPEAPSPANATAHFFSKLRAQEEAESASQESAEADELLFATPAEETGQSLQEEGPRTIRLNDDAEVPDFLKDLEPAPEPVESGQPVSEPDSQLPVEPVDLNLATLDELERLPGIGDQLAESIFAYRETYGPFGSLEELQNVAGIGPETVDDLRQWIIVNIAPDTTAQAEEQPESPDWLADLEKEEQPGKADEALPDWLRGEIEADTSAQPVTPTEWQPASFEEPQAQSEAPQANAEQVPPTQPKVAAVRKEGPAVSDAELAGAQDALGSGDISTALQSYGKLVKKGRMLDEVINDLREAVYRYPVEVTIWQTLGDAYMRANRLQDALDAYTKAEELLR